VRGSWMIHHSLCRFLQIPTALTEAELIPSALTLTLDFSDPHTDNPTTACDIVRKVYAIEEDDLGLRASLQLERERRAEGFDALRRHYRVRREFASVQLRGEAYLRQHLSAQEFQRLQALGFTIT